MICILYGFSCEMDFSHHESPNHTLISQVFSAWGKVRSMWESIDSHWTFNVSNSYVKNMCSVRDTATHYNYLIICRTNKNINDFFNNVCSPCLIPTYYILIQYPVNWKNSTLLSRTLQIVVSVTGNIVLIYHSYSIICYVVWKIPGWYWSWTYAQYNLTSLRYMGDNRFYIVCNMVSPESNYTSMKFSFTK